MSDNNPQFPNMLDYFGSLHVDPASSTEGQSSVNAASIDVTAVADVLEAARRQWQQALPQLDLPDIDIRFDDLPAGELGQAIVTQVDAGWRPVSGTLILDKAGDGRGWFLDATPDDHGEFSRSLTTTAFAAPAGIGPLDPI